MFHIKNPIYLKKYPNIDPRFLFVNLGYNLRPTEIQGAFGIHQVPKLEKFIEIRRKNAAYWNKKFSQYEDYFIIPKDNAKSRSVHFCFPITIRKDAPFNRKMLVRFLEKNQIQTRPVMSGNFVEQPVINLIPHLKQDKLPNSHLVMNNSFFFGNHQKIGRKQREYVVDVFAQFIERKLWK